MWQKQYNPNSKELGKLYSSLVKFLHVNNSLTWNQCMKVKWKKSCDNFVVKD